ncbi:MAG: hypothetical protein WDA17_02540 [Sphaerochaetaceae bacterium]|jgi:hypothetical protein
MENNFQIIYGKQDISKRISLLHRQETFSIGLISVGSEKELISSTERLYDFTNIGSLFVLLYQEHENLKEIAKQFPKVTFILFNEPLSFGTLANVMANQCHSTYFLLTRTNLEFTKFEYKKGIEVLNGSKKAALVTFDLTNRFGEALPVIQVPFIRDNLIDPISFFPTEERLPTLYPYFGIGLYERALFQRLRGFDEAIESEYWQFLDFGLRCWLYGYPIMYCDAFKASFSTRQFVIENRSESNGIKRVHTRALGFRTVRGKNYTKRIPKYFDSKVYNDVKKVLPLYKQDFYSLIESWPAPGEQR